VIARGAVGKSLATPAAAAAAFSETVIPPATARGTPGRRRELGIESLIQ
jgi:hypothetical protein